MKQYHSLVENAWSLISPSWPLQNFIAVNPLMGFQALPFHQAIEKNTDYARYEKENETLAIVNNQTIKWCQAFFDQGQAIISMPYKNCGLFLSWKNLILHDSTLHHNNSRLLNYLKHLPDNSTMALYDLLMLMSFPEEKIGIFFEILLMSLKGWAGYVKYLAEWAPDDETHFLANNRKTLMMDYLAMRTILFYCINGNINVKFSEHGTTIPADAYDFEKNETMFRKHLLYKIHENFFINKTIPYSIPPTIQCIFCIDVRSEPVRRSIEQKKGYETLGFAGFFAAPSKFELFHQDNIMHGSPVLIKPQHTAKVCLCDGEKEQRFLKRKSWRERSRNIYAALKYNIGSPCILADASGPWLGLWMITKTFFPRLANAIREKLHAGSTHSLKTFIDKESIDLSTQVAWAETFLGMLNLSHRLASVVILFGHSAKTENNPYASALECGACGANGGGYNATLMAKILNDALVREHLAQKGISIPDSTVFIAAEHMTTTQNFHFYNFDELPLLPSLKQKITDDFREITHSLSTFDKTNSVHWAETRPEWGLARNAAFIIGPRDLSAPLNLAGRAFLHSYDWEADSEGTALETIMTAPLIVAQWINHQYFFSAFDHSLYGGGSKITQNITGKFGVMQGNASDLMSGLSLQALYATDQEPYHQAQRLLVVILAPRTRVELIIQKHAVLQSLFFNEWLFLVVIEPNEKSMYSLIPENNRNTLSWRKNDEYLFL